MNTRQERVIAYPSKRVASDDETVSGTFMGNAVVLRTAIDRLASRFLPVMAVRAHDTMVGVHRTVQIALRGRSQNRSVSHVLCREHGQNEALLQRRLTQS